jgi:hypothetical protein
MLRFALLLLTATCAAGFAMFARGAPTSPSNPLALYQGSWLVTRSKAGAGAKPDHLTNYCAQLGKYFACQETVNGSVVGLLVFIPTPDSGHFYTQTILPEGRATGQDELEIAGNQWIFKSRRQEGSKITYYRTTNTFSGRTRIHFEQAESTDGKQWTTKNSGDETKVSK